MGLAAACCGGVPLVIAGVGGLAVGAVVGIAGGLIGLGGLAAVGYVVVRRRRAACRVNRSPIPPV